MAGGRRALAHTFSSQYSTIIIQFVVVVVISRLLGPEEIGIFSVGAAFVALGQLLRDFGTGQYIVQEKELTTDRIRAAFTVTLGLGWSISAVVFLLSGLVADFYEQPGLRDILNVLAVNFLLLPFGTITVAYLRRQMNFKPAAIARVGAALVSGVVSIALALRGFSYMSLAWGSLAGSIATILIVAMYRPKDLPWLPGLHGVRRVLGFGSKISGVSILAEVSTLTPELVLGKTQGFHEVGLFSRTKGTMNMFGRLVTNALRPVVGSLFAEMSREKQSIREPYLLGLSCLTGLAWAFFANLAVLAPEFVVALYGSKWAPIIPFVQVWCMSSAVYHLTSLMDQVLVSTGNVDRLLRLSVILQPLRIVAFAFTATVGLEAVFLVVLITPWIRLLLLWTDVKKIAGATLTDYVAIVRASGGAALVSALTAAVTSWGLVQAGVTEPLIKFLLCAMAAGLVWLYIIFVTQHSLRNEIMFVVKRLAPKVFR